MRFTQIVTFLVAGILGGIGHQWLFGAHAAEGGNASADKSVLKVQRVIVVDAEGTAVGQWDADGIRIFGSGTDSGATIRADKFVLTRGKGKARVDLEVRELDGARAYLTARHESSEICVAADPTGGASISLRRPDCSNGLVMSANTVEGVEKAWVKLLDGAEKQRATMRLDNDHASIVILDKEEKVASELK